MVNQTERTNQKADSKNELVKVFQDHKVSYFDRLSMRVCSSSSAISLHLWVVFAFLQHTDSEQQLMPQLEQKRPEIGIHHRRDKQPCVPFLIRTSAFKPKQAN